MNNLKDKKKYGCNLTLSCPPTLLRILDDYVMKGKGKSRSELVRTAIREYILRETLFDEIFDKNKDRLEDLFIDALIKTKEITIDGIKYIVKGEA